MKCPAFRVRTRGCPTFRPWPLNCLFMRGFRGVPPEQDVREPVLAGKICNFPLCAVSAHFSPYCTRDVYGQECREGWVDLLVPDLPPPCAQEVQTSTRKSTRRMMRAETMIPRGRELKNSRDRDVAGDVESAPTAAVQMEAWRLRGLGDRFSTKCH